MLMGSMITPLLLTTKWFFIFLSSGMFFQDKNVEKCKTVTTPKLQILFWNILENVRRKDTIIDYSVFI